jgi:uncharacterized RDD family membrane protein YckC
MIKTPTLYAGFWKRKTAYAADVLIVLVLASLASWLLGSVAHAQSAADIQALQNAGLIGNDVNSAALTAAFSQFGLDVGDSSDITFDLFVSFATSAIYNIYLVAGPWQATCGKRWCGLKVVMRDGSPLTLKQSAMRHVASGLSMTLMGLGYMTMFFNREKAALHDLICDTRVVVGKPNI